MAASYGQTDVINLLLNHSANVNDSDLVICQSDMSLIIDCNCNYVFAYIVLMCR